MNDHGWTLEQVKTYEKTIKRASLAKRAAVIRLIMEGHYAMEAAKMLNVHRDIVSAYVKIFNQGGMEALLHRGPSPGTSSIVTGSGK